MLDSTGGADTAAATGAGPAGSNSGSSSSSSGDVLDELINGAPNASAVAAALLTHGALGTPSRSGLLVHGSHAQDGSSDDVEELLMWQLAGCHDAQVLDACRMMSCIAVCLPVSLPACLPAYFSVCLPVCLSVCLPGPPCLQSL
jgi:hypothetical protein